MFAQLVIKNKTVRPKILSDQAHSWIYSARKQQFSGLQCNTTQKMFWISKKQRQKYIMTSLVSGATQLRRYFGSPRNNGRNILWLLLSFDRCCIELCKLMSVLWDLGHNVWLWVFLTSSTLSPLSFYMKSAAFSPMHLPQPSHKDTMNMVLGDVKFKERKQNCLYLFAVSTFMLL